jgi:hypothetical protein
MKKCRSTAQQLIDILEIFDLFNWQYLLLNFAVLRLQQANKIEIIGAIDVWNHFVNWFSICKLVKNIKNENYFNNTPI